MTSFFSSFENQFVSAQDISLPPGQVMAIEGDKDTVLLVLSGWPSLGQTSLSPGAWHYVRAPYQTLIKNDMDASARLVFCELIRASGRLAGDATLAGVPLHHLFFENEYIEAYRAIFPPGSATGWHHHSRAGLAVVMDGGVMTIESASGIREVDYIRGALRWHADGVAHAITNTGDTTVHLIDMEWK